MHWWLIYLLLGGFAGLFAGLLGVGGGLTVVPLLLMIFAAQDLPEAHLMQLALGTAMAGIVFTSISSLRAHHLHAAVDWQVVRRIAPGIVAGTLLGTALAGQLHSRALAIFFALFAYAAATQLLLNVRPKPTRELPGKAGMTAIGGAIGGVCSLVAAGGGLLMVPFLAFCNVPLHRAIGTAAAVGFPIAVAGTFGYIVNGSGKPGLPEHAFGFVYLPALFWLVAASMLTAPLGAKIAHRMKVANLRKVFAALLYVLATKMLASVL